ncbi:MAG: metal-sulfur cluster assembly factor [Anaerolineales bacterium]|jgi:metal-sulfur cluster biosynthetic enzyme
MSDEKGSIKTLWEVDSTHPEQAEKLRAGLREVLDPEIGISIIELGLVREVSIQDDSVIIKMILTTPFCPYGPALLEMARAKAEQSSGLKSHIELSMQAWSPSMMEGDGAAWGFF